MKNKRGQELSTSTIILIILGVIVLVVLAIGFYFGWDTLKGWFPGGGANIDKVLQSCETACTSHSTYDFCNKKRDLKTEDAVWKNVTCNYLAVRQNQFGVRACTEIPCSNIAFANDEAAYTAGCPTAGTKTLGGKTVQWIEQGTNLYQLHSKDCVA